MFLKLKQKIYKFLRKENKKGLDNRKTVKFGDPSADGSGKIYSVLSILLIFAIWFIVSELELVPPLFCPSPIKIFEKFIEISTEGYRGNTLAGHVLISMYRIFVGFVLGCIAGIPIGISMGLSKIIRGSMDPIIELYRPVPPLAFIPLIIVWMGIGDQGKIFLLFLSVFPIMVINSRSGVRNINIEKIQAAYSLGASRWQVLYHVILINALPEIFTGMRVAIGVAWGTLVAAEMVAASSGIGWMVINSARFLRTDIVIMGIIVMGCIGYTFDLFIRTVEKKIIPWKGKE